MELLIALGIIAITLLVLSGLTLAFWWMKQVLKEINR